MVASVTRGARAVSFDYGPDRSRFKRVDITPAGITTTVYAGGGATEVITRPGGGSEMKTYIGDFAVVTTPTTPAGGASVTQYLHRDHLGSVDTITNAAGQVVQRMSFDSWGKRREVSWLTMTDGAIAAFDTTATTTRGFTGHEMIDPVGLVHMNGRVYDPEIGRFLSADPFVQETGNLQSWNRYSYVLNNPLSFTDPSGFFFSKLFKSIGKALGSAFRAIGAAVKKILQNPIFRAIINIVGCALPGVGQLACAAITGALTAAAGGSLADSLKAAAFAFVSAGVWDQVGAFLKPFAGQAGFALLKAGVHGVVGGALSVAQGGTFLQGFAANAIGALGGFAGESLFGAAGTGEFGGRLARTLIAAAAGCGGAVITGGKCAEAALTAGFAHLYNQEGILRFGGESGRLMKTPNSERQFDSINAAWSSALAEMVNLGRSNYPDEATSNKFIPELGVEISESKGKYSYDGIVVGNQERGLRFGWVSYDFPGNPNIAARGHMHWINIEASAGDHATANAYHSFRVQSGRPSYQAFVGDWSRSYRLYHLNGRQP